VCLSRDHFFLLLTGLAARLNSSHLADGSPVLDAFQLALPAVRLDFQTGLKMVRKTTEIEPRRKQVWAKSGNSILNWDFLMNGETLFSACALIISTNCRALRFTLNEALAISPMLS
jgi:hypothetical protein